MIYRKMLLRILAAIGFAALLAGPAEASRIPSSVGYTIGATSDTAYSVFQTLPDGSKILIWRCETATMTCGLPGSLVGNFSALNIGGNTVLGGALTVRGSAEIQGNTVLDGAVSMKGSAGVQGDFNVSGTLNTAGVVNAAGLIIGKSTTGDSDAQQRQLSDRFAESTSVRDFCSQVDGSTDNTTCTQIAINRLCARGDASGRLFFPPGAYVLNQVVIPCSGLQLVGAGRGDRDQSTHNTKIIPLSAGGANPVFYFHVTSFTGIGGRTGAPSCCASYSYGGVVRDMGFVDNGGRSGPMIQMDDVQGGLVDNVYAWNAHTLVKFFGGIQNRVTNFYGDQFVDGGRFIQCMGDDSKDSSGNYIHRLDVCKIDHGYMAQGNSATSGACVYIQDFVQTVQIENTECETSSYALQASCPTLASGDNCPAFMTLYDFEAEAFGGAQRDMVALSDVHEFRFLGGVLDGGTQGSTGINNLISFKPGRFSQSTVLDVQNSKIKHSTGACIYALGSQVVVMGNRINGCGAFSTANAVFAGVEFGSSGSAPRGDGSVIGNIFCIDEANSVGSSSRMRPVLINDPIDGVNVGPNTTWHCPNQSVSNSAQNHNYLLDNSR